MRQGRAVSTGEADRPARQRLQHLGSAQGSVARLSEARVHQPVRPVRRALPGIAGALQADGDGERRVGERQATIPRRRLSRRRGPNQVTGVRLELRREVIDRRSGAEHGSGHLVTAWHFGMTDAAQRCGGAVMENSRLHRYASMARKDALRPRPDEQTIDYADVQSWGSANKARQNTRSTNQTADPNEASRQ